MYRPLVCQQINRTPNGTAAKLPYERTRQARCAGRTRCRAGCGGCNFCFSVAARRTPHGCRERHYAASFSLRLQAVATDSSHGDHLHQLPAVHQVSSRSFHNMSQLPIHYKRLHIAAPDKYCVTTTEGDGRTAFGTNELTNMLVYVHPDFIVSGRCRASREIDVILHLHTQAGTNGHVCTVWDNTQVNAPLD